MDAEALRDKTAGAGFEQRSCPKGKIQGRILYEFTACRRRTHLITITSESG